MKTLTILLAIATLSTQAALAGHENKHPDQARPQAQAAPRQQMAPRQFAPREAAPHQFAPREAAPHQFAPREAAPHRFAPREAAPHRFAPREAAPHQFAPREAAPHQFAPREAAPHQFAPREAAPRQFAPVMHERAIRAIPVRGDNSAAAVVWRSQHPGVFRERAMPVRGDDSALDAVWRDRHEGFVRRNIVFERFHPRRVMFVDPVWVAPAIVTPQIVTPQFVMPVANIAPVSSIFTGFAPMYVPAIGYAPTFAAVPIFDPAYASYVNVAPVSPFAAYSNDDCDDDCQGPAYVNPSYVNYVQPAYTYVGPSVNPFGNAQLQGVVIGQTGSNLIVLAPNLQPVFVNTGVAEQAGFIQGDVAPGSVINALGYYTGNEFIATSLV